MPRILLIPLLGIAAVLIGCQNPQPGGQLQIITPSKQKITVTCPSNNSAAGQRLCQQAADLARAGRQPRTLMLCRGQYFSLSGYLLINGRQRELEYSWDCNTIRPFTSVLQAVEDYSDYKLGAQAGNSDYRPPGRQQ